MKILIDTREQRPYTFASYSVATEVQALPVGDYSLAGFADCVSIERKQLGDLIGCLKNGERVRFSKELNKLRFYELSAVVVEGTVTDIARHRYRSQMAPQAVLQSIFAFWVRYQVPFIFCSGRKQAEYVTFSLLEKYSREIQKRAEVLANCG